MRTSLSFCWGQVGNILSTSRFSERLIVGQWSGPTSNLPTDNGIPMPQKFKSMVLVISAPAGLHLVPVPPVRYACVGLAWPIQIQGHGWEASILNLLLFLIYCFREVLTVCFDKGLYPRLYPWYILILLVYRCLSWCVSVSQPPAEVCLTDLAWDYPGV